MNCIWNCPIEDRKCEYCTFRGGCDRYPLHRESVRPQRYIAIMEEIIGEPVLSRTRHRLPVWARNMIAYQLWQDGFKSTEIAKIFGFDHSTIVHCRKQVGKMLKMPRMYSIESEIWRKFQESIKPIES